MGYGLGVFLLAVGLILVYAVQDSINGVDLTTVGWILVLAGVLVIVLTAVHEPRARDPVGRDHDPPRRQPDHDRAAAAQRPAAGGLTALRGRAPHAAPASARPAPDRADAVLGAVAAR